jgi:hypothetical protein
MAVLTRFCAGPAKQHSIWRPTFTRAIVCRVDAVEKLSVTERHVS